MKNTTDHNPSEEKIRMVLDGLRSEGSIAEICRREGINAGHYQGSKIMILVK